MLACFFKKKGLVDICNHIHIYMETSTLCWLILLIVCIAMHISDTNVTMERWACNTVDVKDTYILLVVLQVACHW